MRSKRRLVLIRTAELFKGQRNGTNVLLACISHEPEKCTRIDPRRQKGADFDISKKMRSHTIGYGRTYRISQLGIERWDPAFRCKDRCESHKWFWLARARGIDPLAVSRGQRTDITMGCERFRNAAK